MGATTVHPALPMLRQAERTLANAIAGGLDQLSGGSEEISGLILQLRESGLEQVAGALERSLSTEDRAQRAGNLLRAYAALGIVRSRLVDGASADLTDAPLLSEESHLYIPPLPTGKDLETLDGTLAVLTSHDPLHRMYAAVRVPQWGDPVIPRLLALAKDTKQDVNLKRIAARCISQIETPAALDALVKLTDVLDAWREVNDGLMQRGAAVVEPLQTTLSVASADGAWLAAKILWRLGAAEALQKAYATATAPKATAPAATAATPDKKGKVKATKPAKPKAPKINKAFAAYHLAISSAKERVEAALAVKRWQMPPTQRIIYLLIGLEQGLITEDQFISELDSQQRNELRISLRHVYGSPAHALTLDYFRRMQRTATKYADTQRAQIGISVLGEMGLDAISEPEEDDEDEEDEE